MTASHCRYGHIDGTMTGYSVQSSAYVASIRLPSVACVRCASTAMVHCSTHLQADAGHANVALCWPQVTAVPCRQGSGVSMHELRLPSSSSVTAHRWCYPPSLLRMVPSGDAYCKAHQLVRGVPLFACLG